jgi:hypothetical protein
MSAESIGSKVGYSTLDQCVAKCKKDINNLSNVPDEFMTMELVKQVGQKEINSAMNFMHLYRFSGEVQDMFIGIWRSSLASYNKLINGIPTSFEKDDKKTQLVRKMLDKILEDRKGYIWDDGKMKTKHIMDNLDFVLGKIKERNLRVPFRLFNGITLNYDQFVILFDNKFVVLMDEDSTKSLYPSLNEYDEEKVRSAVILPIGELDAGLLFSDKKVYIKFEPHKEDKFVVTEDGIKFSRSGYERWGISIEEYIQQGMSGGIKFNNSKLNQLMENYKGNKSGISFIEYIKLFDVKPESFDYLSKYNK